MWNFNGNSCMNKIFLVFIVYLYYYQFEALMGIFEERKNEKESYQNMYYMNSLSLQQDRYLCENNYLSNPKKTYLLKKPLA